MYYLYIRKSNKDLTQKHKFIYLVVNEKIIIFKQKEEVIIKN